MLRFASALPSETYPELFGVAAPELATPRYNVAPGQWAPLVRGAAGEREAGLARWGLVPAHSRSLRSAARLGLTHARAEKVLHSATYAEAFSARRALIPVSGYYTWAHGPELALPDRVARSRRQPHYIHRKDDRPLVLAGVWTRWTGGERPLDSFAVLTVASSQDVAHLDERMPAIVLRRDWARWLDPRTSPQEAHALLDPFATGVLCAHPVTRDVGNLRLDDPRLLRPVA